MRHVARRSIGPAVLAAAVLASSDAKAVGTRTFELDTLDKLSGGDTQGVSVGSDGVVRAGWTLGNLAFPENAGATATSAVALADGSVLVGTGPSAGGKVVRIANGQSIVWADTKESAVNALAVDRAGNVYAATTSSRIYRISQGKAELFATLPGVESVFALAVDKSGTALFAATGSEGTVLRIEPSGVSSVYFKTSDPFVVSLAITDDGTVYAGTSGKGLLYRITAPGRATVVYDFPGEDVHAIAAGPSGSVYAIVDEEPSGSPTETPESSRAHTTSGRFAPGPTPAVRTRPGKGSLWRFDAQGRPERLMHHDEFHYLSLAVDAHGTPYVGTGAEGRIYTVDDTHAVSLLAHANERQIAAIGSSNKTWFAIGSDPSTFHQLLSIGGADSVWTSKPLDAGVRARFGHATWRSAGAVEVSTRTGDTQTPDTTWSPWSAPIAQGGAIPSPPGRFVQIRGRLRDSGATLTDLIVPFVTENLRAIITEVGARERTAREPREPMPSSGSEPPKHDSVVHVTWKVDNPDNDELRFRVQFRQEGQPRWLDATRRDDVLTKPELDWDTATLPEGKYRLRVDASDELANPPSESLHFALESPPLLVDNTPPFFKSLSLQGRRLRAEVADGLGPIARVDVAIDGRAEWRPLAPLDGIFDTADESIDTDLTPLLVGLDSGPHIVAVRAFDAAGNSVVREVQTP
ncbi:MAG TPA: hypothetical protein VEK07_20390 [Polyangiaceae bacterium]|nr:hypothetical protein [Polyangiaceae bacterium]